MSAPNISRIEVREMFCFRAVALKELYDAIGSLDNNKFPGPGIFITWPIEAPKFAIGTHLQLILNTGICPYVFPENSKLAFISPVLKNWM